MRLDRHSVPFRALVLGVVLGLVMAMLNAFAFSVPRAEAVPAGSEYPASWTIAGNVATGTTPSGVVVTATLTGPVTFAGSGGLVFGGPSPAFFPPTTTEALQFINTTCTSTAPSGCGSITYAFSEPVTTPVFYTGDIGSGVISASNPPTFSEYRNTPQTLTSGGTFSLDTPGSQTSNVAITNGGTTVGIINPAGRVGTAASTNSCDPAGFGCGTYAISTPTPTVESITIGFSNAGVGVEGDAFTQVVGITPLTPSISMTKTVSPQTISAAGQEARVLLRRLKHWQHSAVRSVHRRDSLLRHRRGRRHRLRRHDARHRRHDDVLRHLHSNAGRRRCRHYQQHRDRFG